MKSPTHVLLLVLLLCVALRSGNSSVWAKTQVGTSQNRVVGEVVKIDQSTKRLTLKTVTGEIEVVAADTTALLRVPPGEASADKASKISFGEILIGDRVFARVAAAEEGKPLQASQVVVTSRSASERQDRSREFRARGIAGRITAINPQTKHLTVFARSRDGLSDVNVDASGTVRFFRYAADSVNLNDARPSSFAEIKVGDQLRALGQKSEDGRRMTAEEIISGSFRRTGGTITGLDPAARRIILKNSQSGETATIVLGERSSLRRITPEIIAAYEETRRGARAPRPAPSPAPGSEPGTRRRGRNLQEMIESLPQISLEDLKKGDTVFVAGTHEQDPSRLTAITLLTGDAAFLTRLFQTEAGRGPQNPGLPSDILGGGVGNRDEPPPP
jgi:hypothetical protein